jgi:hypothetical protein
MQSVKYNGSKGIPDRQTFWRKKSLKRFLWSKQWPKFLSKLIMTKLRFHDCIGYNTKWTIVDASSSWAFPIACSFWISSCDMSQPDYSGNPRRIQQTSNHCNITSRSNLPKSFEWPHFQAAKSWVASWIWKESRPSPKQVHKSKSFHHTGPSTCKKSTSV